MGNNDPLINNLLCCRFWSAIKLRSMEAVKESITMKKEITEQELKDLYQSLDHKGKFILSASEKLEVSTASVKGWFSDAILTSPIPQDGKTRRILKRELDKAPKKVTA